MRVVEVKRYLTMHMLRPSLVISVLGSACFLPLSFLADQACTRDKRDAHAHALALAHGCDTKRDVPRYVVMRLIADIH